MPKMIIIYGGMDTTFYYIKMLILMKITLQLHKSYNKFILLHVHIIKAINEHLMCWLL